jgi:hypothetical protein
MLVGAKTGETGSTKTSNLAEKQLFSAGVDKVFCRGPGKKVAFKGWGLDRLLSPGPR